MSKREGPRIDKSKLAFGVQSYGRVDKTSPDLMIREPERIVDHAYRQSARGHSCDVWGCTADPDTVVLAHFRITLPGMLGATSRKPSDEFSGFLCAFHHDQWDRRVPVALGERELLKDRIMATLLKERYMVHCERGEKD